MGSQFGCPAEGCDARFTNRGNQVVTHLMHRHDWRRSRAEAWRNEHVVTRDEATGVEGADESTDPPATPSAVSRSAGDAGMEKPAGGAAPREGTSATAPSARRSSSVDDDWGFGE